MLTRRYRMTANPANSAPPEFARKPTTVRTLRTVRTHKSENAPTMIESILTGKLHTAAETRTSKAGKHFTVCKMTTPAGAGPALFVNLCAFDQTAAADLLRCRPGDALAVAGTLTPGAWIDKNGEAHPNLSLVVAQVMTLHALARRRAEAAPAAAPRAHAAEDFGPQDWPA